MKSPESASNVGNALRNHGKTWTEDDDRQLIALLKEGKPLETVAAECGRTTGAIVGRMEYLGTQVARYVQLRKLIVDNL